MGKQISFLILGLALSYSAFSQWTEQSTGFSTVSRGINYFSAVDENIVWATAYDGTGKTNYIAEFTRTTDGGANWTPGYITGYTSGYGTSMIMAVDSNVAFVPVFSTSGGGKILKTTDGGSSWSPQTSATFSSPAGFPNVVHFWDADTGWCQGDPNGGYFELYTTIDGGATWIRTPKDSIPTPISKEYGTVGLYSVVGDTIWYSTNKGRVYRSPDKGLSWKVFSTSFDSQFRIIFKDALNGLAYQTSDGSLSSSSDGGETWSIITPEGNVHTGSINYVPGSQSTYISSGSTGVSYSLYNGLLWTDFDVQPDKQVTHSTWVSESCGWAGGFSRTDSTGGVFKYTGTMKQIQAKDIGVSKVLTPSTGAILSTSESMQFEIINYGHEPQSGLTISFAIDRGTYTTESITDTIESGERYVYTTTAKEDFSITDTYVISAYTTLSGDQDLSNDSIEESVLLLNWLPTKRVMGEEATGTWCQWCVRGHVFMEKLAADYPDTWIGVAVHNGDPMANSVYDSGIGALIAGYPSGVVDRISGSIDPSVFESYYKKRIQEIAFADIDIENVSYDNSTRELSFDVKSSFATNISSANYRLNAVIVENHVTGTTSGYNQKNAYAGGGSGVMGGYESLPSTVPAASMVYDNVGRAILGGWNGTAASIPASINANDEFSHTYTYTIDSTWNEQNIKLIGFIINNSTGEIMNANISHPALSINESSFVDNISIYPNPSCGKLFVENAEYSTISITSLIGKQIVEYNNISNSLEIDISNQPTGIYFIRIQNENKVLTKKIVLTN